MITAIGFSSLLALVVATLPLAFAMLLVGFVGFAVLTGIEPALFMIGQVVHSSSASFSLSVLPLFILMGNFVARSRLADDLFFAADHFVGHRRGGLAQATLLACGGLAAVSGSSSATAATMVKVALPAMRARSYDDRLAAGSIAVGGTLGILIPPSAILLLYGILTETDIVALFAAGILPGLLAIALHMTAISVMVRADGSLGPTGPKMGWRDRFQALSKVWGILALFLLVMGGILGGVFTPTEGGAVGAFGAMLFALYRRALSLSSLYGILVETGTTTAMIFAVVFGAFVFSNFLDVTGFPSLVGQWVSGFSESRWLVLVLILAIYILLGAVMEIVSMLFLTVPLFFPIVMGLGFDPIWFGIVVVIVIELGLITPPVGLNLFVIKAMAPDITHRRLMGGTAPFVVSLMILLALVVAFPSISGLLPRLL